MVNITRIRQLAGLLLEADPQVMSSDEIDDYDDRAENERYARETHIKGMISHAFNRIGIELADSDDSSAIFYSEDDREAVVQLDDSQIDIDLLIRLKKTGLAQQYRVQIGSNHALDIVFTVSPILDRAN